MAVHEVLVFNQRRISRQLRRDVGVATEKLSKVSVRDVVIGVRVAAVTILVQAVFGAIVASFLLHEAVRVLFDCLTNLWMVLQISLQSRMVLYELPIIHERRIFPELLGNFPMAIEEVIEICQFRAVGVTVAIVFAAVQAIFLLHEGIRVLSQLLTNCGMVLQIGLQRGVIAEPRVWVLYARWKGLASAIKAGEYEIEPLNGPIDPLIENTAAAWPGPVWPPLT